MSKNKILFIITPYEIGGAEEYIYLLTKALGSVNDITIACPSNSKFDGFIKRLEKNRCNIKRLNIKSRRAYKIPTILPAFDLRQIYCIYNLIKKINPDIIHINQSDPESDFSVIIAANMFRYAKIVSKIHIAHSFRFMNVPFGFIRDKWVSFFLNLFSFTIITGSHDTKSLLCNNYLINKNRIFVVHYGIDIPRYDISTIANEPEQIKEYLGIDKNYPIVGFIGRLTKQKCPVDFLKIALKVIKKIGNVYFIMLGNGELEEEVKKFILDSNLYDKVRLLGFVNNVPECISIMEMLILPSLYESFGLVLAEAGAIGKPVIASKIGGIEEVVKDGETGFLIDNRDIDKYAEKIIYLLENPDIANKMGTAAQKRIHEKFSMYRMARDTISVYEKLLTKKNG